MGITMCPPVAESQRNVPGRLCLSTVCPVGTSMGAVALPRGCIWIS